MTTVYSERLGLIRDEQFAAALARFDLGDFVAAAPTTAGLFGQNVFVTSTRGEFVLRGAPHWVKDRGIPGFRREDRWQFTKETFFAERLHESTRAPVPWPYRYDETSDIFGWPYLLVPRMPGRCFDDRSLRRALDADARRAIAVALGENLAEMQRLTWPYAADFDTRSIELSRYPGGAMQRVVDELHEFLVEADANDAITPDDRAWVESLTAAATEHTPARCTYVHGDYHLANVTVRDDAGDWCVSGVFDLHTSHFGDGLIDAVRPMCGWLDTDPALVRPFFDAYRRAATIDRDTVARMPLYVANDRSKFWGYFTRPETRAEWTRDRTFRGWAERYVQPLVDVARDR